jgi:hypothetical protein
VEIAGRIPEVAERITAQKQELLALCRSPGFTLEKLRAAVTQSH